MDARRRAMRRLSCFHFTGIGHPACAKGILYAVVRQAHRLPCLQSMRREAPLDNCEHRRPTTDAEIDADDARSDAAIREHLAKLAAGRCPTCGNATEPRRQVSSCVYGACGHRLYQGIL